MIGATDIAITTRNIDNFVQYIQRGEHNGTGNVICNKIISYYSMCRFMSVCYFTCSSHHFSVFPDCIRVNEIFTPTTHYLDVYKQVYKSYSADHCATKGKEEVNKHHSSNKRITWSWFSLTNECVIHTGNDDPEMKLRPINLGKHRT